MLLATSATASFILRLGLAVEFLVFGYEKLVDMNTWVGFIPPWLHALLPVSITSFLLLVGAIELTIGILLLIGLGTRIVAALAALHLIAVLITIGYSDLAVRDFVSFAAAVALTILGHSDCHWSCDGWRHQRSMVPHRAT